MAGALRAPRRPLAAAPADLLRQGPGEYAAEYAEYAAAEHTPEYAARRKREEQRIARLLDALGQTILVTRILLRGLRGFKQNVRPRERP